jgi:hypothetical protein
MIAQAAVALRGLALPAAALKAFNIRMGGADNFNHINVGSICASIDAIVLSVLPSQNVRACTQHDCLLLPLELFVHNSFHHDIVQHHHHAVARFVFPQDEGA